MEVTVNKDRITLADNASVKDLLDQILGEKQKGVAIAIENVVLPRTDWQQRILIHGEKLILIRATQGG